MTYELSMKMIGFSLQRLANSTLSLLYRVPRICNLLEASRGHH